MKNYGFNNENENTNEFEKDNKPAEVSRRGFVSNCYLVNVREKADILSNVFAQLGKGCEVVVTGDSVDGFYPVKYREQAGFIKSEFLEVI